MVMWALEDDPGRHSVSSQLLEVSRTGIGFAFESGFTDTCVGCVGSCVNAKYCRRLPGCTCVGNFASVVVYPCGEVGA